MYAYPCGEPKKGQERVRISSIHTFKNQQNDWQTWYINYKFWKKNLHSTTHDNYNMRVEICYNTYDLPYNT